MLIRVSWIRTALLFLVTAACFWSGVVDCHASLVLTQWKFLLKDRTTIICEIVNEGKDQDGTEWYQIRVPGTGKLQVIRESQVADRQPDEADVKELVYTDGRTARVWIDQEGDTWLKIRTGTDLETVSVVRRAIIKNLTPKYQRLLPESAPVVVALPKPSLPSKEGQTVAPVEKQAATPMPDKSSQNSPSRPGSGVEHAETKVSGDVPRKEEPKNVESIGPLAFQSRGYSEGIGLKGLLKWIGGFICVGGFIILAKVIMSRG